ncbi:MAG TPA: hypothetical protein VMM13_12020 [Euzebya sp.]|nr:hypothetical protein [Euzebya sp.]
MDPRQIRKLLTTIHLVTMPFMGYYVYSPIHEHPALQLIGRWVVFPIMLITGVVMWQWARIRKAQARRQRGTTAR